MGPDKGILSWLESDGGPSPDVYHRIWMRVRQWLNEGVGIYLIGVILICVGAVACRIGLIEFQNYHRALTKHVNGMMARNEPRQHEDYPGVTAAVLAPLNLDSKQWSYKRVRELKPKIDRIGTVFQYLVTVAYDRERRLDLNRIQFSENGLDRETWEKRTNEHLRQLRQLIEGDESLNLPKVVRPKDTSELLTKRQLVFGPIGTESDYTAGPSQTTLVVPSHLFPNPESNVPVHLDAVNEARTVSLFLEDALNLVLDDNAPPKDEPRIVQAYFISPLSVLRIWPGDTHPHRKYPPTRAWASSYYFRWFEDKENKDKDVYDSPAYIDFGQKGIIRTHVQLIESPAGQVLGILCVDYSIPLNEFLSKLSDHSQFLNCGYIEFSDKESVRGASDFEIQSLPLAPKGVQDDGLSRVEFPESQAVRRGIQELARKRGVDDVLSRISELRLGSPPRVFLIPLGQTASSGYALLVAVPTTPGLPARCYWTFGVTIVCFASLLGCATLRAWQSSEESQHEVEQTMLKSLQVGVVVVDMQDRIIKANDRAEELLVRRLPKIGSREAAAEAVVSELFCDQIIEIDDQGELADTLVSYASSIPKRRANAEASRYFARLRTNNRWLRVSGTPLLTANQTPTSHRSFGIIEPVGRTSVDTLEEIWDRSREGG